MNRSSALFDVNGSFGCSSYEIPAFRKAPDLLKHMDRLGISRSLVWYKPGRHMWCNHSLIKEIEEAGESGKRLIPVFSVSPDMVYQPEALSELKHALSSGQVRAIKIFPGNWQTTIKPIEPIIEETEQFKPLLLVDSRYDIEPEDILYFACKYPGLPIVYMQCMWDQYPVLFDLMRRRENIYADTSWLHTNGTIEMIVREFGAGRLLFGTGSKAHNGASIASLMHAEISDEEKERILHLNLEQLLGINPLQDNRVTGMDGRVLWNRLLDKLPLGHEVIDAHAHLNAYEGGEDAEVIGMLRKMDRIGIKTTIVSGMQALESDPVKGNLLLEERLKPYGQRFKGYLVFNPNYGSDLIPLLDDFFSRGFFIGLKALCSYWRMTLQDERFQPAWEYADKRRLPILLHTWDDEFNSPAMLEEIVKIYKGAVFIIAHSGGGDRGRQEAVRLASCNSNVFLEFCGSFASSIPWEDTIKKVGKDRIIFGTDASGHEHAWELGRLLSVDVPDSELIPALGENMRGILKNSYLPTVS